MKTSILTMIEMNFVNYRGVISILLAYEVTNGRSFNSKYNSLYNLYY